MLYLNSSIFQAHPFHMVSPSPWPLYCSMSLLSLTSSAALFFHGFSFAEYGTAMSLLSLILSMSLWFSDIMAEATYLGNHTSAVQSGLNMGMALFMVSEAMFFLAIFWTFFHSAVAPSVEVGVTWPPEGVDAMDSLELPLLNTLLLLCSGFTVTYAHHYMMNGYSAPTMYGLLATMLLAIIFTLLQNDEYELSSFSLADSSFGSSFYFGTGFHGFHVMIGTCFLMVAFFREFAYHHTTTHHVGLESAMLYWHFVDVVWLFLYCSMYYWGS